MRKDKPLTDKQLIKKVVKEFRAIQKVEYDLMMQKLSVLVESDHLPLDWRKRSNKTLYKYLLHSVQIPWEPHTEADKKHFNELKKLGL